MKSSAYSAYLLGSMLPVVLIGGGILVSSYFLEYPIIGVVLGLAVGTVLCLWFWKKAGMTLIMRPNDAHTTVKVQKRILIAIFGAGAIVGFYMLLISWPAHAILKWNPIFAIGLIYTPSLLIAAMIMTMWRIHRSRIA